MRSGTLEARPTRPRRAVRAGAGAGWGPLPVVALCVAVGLALVAVAFALGRSGGRYGEPLFWLGLVAIVAPIALRLGSDAASEGERMALVVMAGVALYGVKVMHDPFAFASADELVHQHNVEEVLRTGHLFGPNSILPVTSLYPGLAAATAALAACTGMSSFAAGVILIGVARLLFMLALYLSVKALTHSGQIAGIAALVYTATANFVFFSGAFAYESLALPLAVVCFLATVQHEATTNPPRKRSWTIVVLVVCAATVPTHHLTAYALVALLSAWAAVHAVIGRLRSGAGPWRLAAAAAALTALWLVFVASRTVGYLTPVISNALETTFQTLAREAPSRGLFESKTGQVAPIWDRAVGVASALAIVALLPFGLRVLWQRFRWSPAMVMLGVTALFYPVVQALRLVPSAWETGVRTTDFVFLGVATVVALALTRGWWRAPAALCAFVLLVISGGIVTGQAHDLRLARTYRIAADTGAVDPPAVAAARWTRTALGRGRRFAAEEPDARFLQAYGGQFALAGSNPDIVDLLHSPALEPWEPGLIRRYRLDYAAVEPHRLAADRELGFYFPTAAAGTDRPDKFDQSSRTDRIFDSGDVVIYDIHRIGHGPRRR